MKLLGLSVLATMFAIGPARANLVTNGNFATGDFTGWTNPAGSGILIDQTFPAPGDTYDAAFGGTGTLSQSIATVPGMSYMLGFSLLDESGYFGDTFTVGFGGFSTTITGDAAMSHTAESFVVPAADITSSGTTLSFTGMNLSTDWNLDDVSVTETGTAIPEPPVDGLFVGALGLMMVGWGMRRYRLGGPIRAMRDGVQPKRKP